MFQTMGGVFSGKEQDATRGIYAFAGRSFYCVPTCIYIIIKNFVKFPYTNPRQAFIEWCLHIRLDHVSLWLYCIW